MTSSVRCAPTTTTAVYCWHYRKLSEHRRSRQHRSPAGALDSALFHGQIATAFALRAPSSTQDGAGNPGNDDVVCNVAYSLDVALVTSHGVGHVTIPKRTLHHGPSYPQRQPRAQRAGAVQPSPHAPAPPKWSPHTALVRQPVPRTTPVSRSAATRTDRASPAVNPTSSRSL